MKFTHLPLLHPLFHDPPPPSDAEAPTCAEFDAEFKMTFCGLDLKNCFLSLTFEVLHVKWGFPAFGVRLKQASLTEFSDHCVRLGETCLTFKTSVPELNM